MAFRFNFIKDDPKWIYLLYYVFFFFTRSSFCLSMLPFYLNNVSVETSVDTLTTGVINDIVKNTDLDKNIIGIPSLSLESKIAHDVNTYNINRDELFLNEIKVLVEKKQMSTHELWELKFKYNYVKKIYIGYPDSIDNSEIIKNVNTINEKKLFSFWESHFEENRRFFQNRFVLKVKREILDNILKECHLPIGLERKEVLSVIKENDFFVNKIDSIMNATL